MLYPVRHIFAGVCIFVFPYAIVIQLLESASVAVIYPQTWYLLLDIKGGRKSIFMMVKVCIKKMEVKNGEGSHER